MIVRVLDGRCRSATSRSTLDSVLNTRFPFRLSLVILRGHYSIQIITVPSISHRRVLATALACAVALTCVVTASRRQAPVPTASVVVLRNATTLLEQAYEARANWPKARGLIVKATKELDGTPSHHADRWWILAAIALIEDAGDAYYLLDPDTGQVDADRRRGEARRFLRWAAARVPDEPRIRLAKVVVRQMLLPGSFVQTPVWMDDAAIARMAAGSSSGLEVPKEVRMSLRSASLIQPRLLGIGNVVRPSPAITRSVALQKLLEDLTSLAAEPAVADEAHVRAGETYPQLGRADRALAELDEVRASADDARLICLAAFFRGQALERLNQLASAAEQYRRSLIAVPRSQSASFSLASILYVNGRQAEADALVADAMRFPLASDPVRAYGRGDAELWPSYIEKLREALR